MVWPFENNTKKVEKRLAKRSLAADRGRNMVAVFTIGRLPDGIGCIHLFGDA